MNPLVSVIMPVYNGERYISNAIESILQQTYNNLELILIDDCGYDDSMLIAQKYEKKDKRVKILRNKKNMGISYSRNVGLDNSQGKYIAIMDDDDYSLKNRLECQVEFLEKHEDVGVVGGKTQWIDEEGKIIRAEIEMPQNYSYIKMMFLFYNIFNNSETLFRRELIEQYNIRYENNLYGLEDFKFWIQMSKCTNITTIEDVVLQYRVSNSNETSRVKRFNAERRRGIFSELQRYSIEMSGFRLSDMQYQLLCKVMSEDGNTSVESRDEMFSLYEIFYEMIIQARKRGMDMEEPMKFWFRDVFADKITMMSAENIWK